MFCFEVNSTKVSSTNVTEASNANVIAAISLVVITAEIAAVVVFDLPLLKVAFAQLKSNIAKLGR